MPVIQLTLHDGRKVGIPSTAAVLLLNLEGRPSEPHPRAKACIRWAVDDRGARVSYVRDTFKHCLTCFPLAIGNQGWAHLTDIDGRDLAIARASGIAYEECQSQRGAFDVTFAVPTGPLTIAVVTNAAGAAALMRPDDPAPPPASAPPAPAAAPEAPVKPAAKPKAKKPPK